MICRTCSTELIPGYKRDGKNWPPSMQAGYMYVCSNCASARERKRYQADPEGAHAYQRSWRAKQGEVYRAYMRKRWADNLESNRTRMSKRRAANREDLRLYYRIWRAKNRRTHAEYMANAVALRRARIANNGPTDNISRRAVWGRDEGHCRVGITCSFGFVSFEEMHLDHIVPISYGGSHTWNNVQTSCAPCNLTKGVRILGGIF
jgi:5-methylcytosine-specific restriction endonuclease McrA